MEKLKHFRRFVNEAPIDELLKALKEAGYTAEELNETLYEFIPYSVRNSNEYTEQVRSKKTVLNGKKPKRFTEMNPCLEAIA